MVERARAFLDRWIEERQAAGERPEGSDGVRAFAERCVRDAALDGIPEDELAAAADGDLPGHLLTALGFSGVDE